MRKETTRNLSTRPSDAAVMAKTGKTWKQWFSILDRAGTSMEHKALVSYLSEKYQLGGWWEQMVVVAYEQERGLRDKYQKPSGYAISVSQTIAAAVALVYQAWESETLRAQWLEDHRFTIRKATPQKSMRVTWTDGRTSLSVNFYPKQDHKCQVTVQHEKLADSEEAGRMKDYWGRNLERLREMLERAQPRRISVLATPNARNEKLERIHGSEYRVAVKEPPEKGRANQAILKLLAKHLGVPPSRLRIISGIAGRKKLIEML